jgi:O-antigen ligase
VERLTFGHGTGAYSGRLRRIERAAAASTAEVRASAVARPETREPRAGLAYWGVFAFTALLFFRPQDTLRPLEALHLSEITAVTALAAMALQRARRGLTPMPVTPEVVGVALFAAAMVLTAPFSIWPSGALHMFTDLFVKVVLVFLLLTHALSSPRLLRRFTWLIVAAMGYIAARGVFDYVRGENLLLGRLQGAVPGLVGNPNDLAMNMVVFLPFAAFGAIAPGRRLARLGAGLVVILMLATAVFTKSRGGFLGLAVVGLLILVQARRLKPGLVIGALVGALVIVPLLPASVWTRASSIFNADEDDTGSRAARQTLLEEGWKTFLERPLTGVGAGQFQNYNPPERREPWRETHNVELQVLAEIGILGGVTFAYLLTRGAGSLLWTWRRFRVRRRAASDPRPAAALESAFDPREREWMRLHVAACIAAFAGWLVCAQFGSIGYHWTLYYVLALITAARLITAGRLEGARSAGATSP